MGIRSRRGRAAVNDSRVGGFVVRTLLWLPACFALWYGTAPYHASIAGAFAHGWLALLTPGLVHGVERTGSSLAFVTTLRVHPQPGQEAVLVPEVSALVYTYGLALFAALTLAVRARWWKILAGAGLLLVFQGWSIAFDLLAQVGIGLGPEVSALAGFGEWRRESIALGYQLGAVIFPTLAPVMVWAFLCGAFIQGVVHRDRGLPVAAS